MTLIKKSLFILVVCGLFSCSDNNEKDNSQTTEEEQKASVTSKPVVQELMLKNGLKVIVKEDHRSPVVASMVWYKVGSSYEPKGLTGIAHVFEHMMFKGTEKYKPNEFSRIIAENGGTDNAFTGRDYTAYFQQLEKSRLAISFEMEADRMRHLKISEEGFVKEIEVVKEERRLRTDDKPEAYTYEAFSKAAYDVSNYQNPIIGWPEDLNGLNVDKLQPWYRRYYAPNNATVVVVGDVQAEEVFTLAEKYFGVLSAEDIPPTPVVLEPLHTEQRRITVERKARVPYLLMGFQAPAIRASQGDDWEPYALQVMAGVLDGGKSARFEKNLIRKQKLAASTWVDYDPVVRLDGMVMIGLTPIDGVSVQQLEQAAWQQIDNIKNQLVEDKELQRVKAQMTANDVFQQDSVFYQAMKIGRLETTGLHWKLSDEWLHKIQIVTAEQVQAVARKYLVKQTSTVAELAPIRVEPAKVEQIKTAADNEG